jgi:hypothetical protein
VPYVVTIFDLIETPVRERGTHDTSTLWEIKWKKRVSSGLSTELGDKRSLNVLFQVTPCIYPFWKGKLEDFEGIFKELIAVRE